MMRSLYSGVSGLKGHQTRMDVIGNNIANVNTTGFKSSRVTFADTLSQTQAGASAPTGNLGGTNPKQIGLGTGVASIDMLFTDGSVQATGKNTDLCLSGNGLFVVKQGNETYYTRDGAFEFDADGNYVLPGSGMLVQGWTAKDGELNTNGAVGGIKVESGKSMAAKVTTAATYVNNLNAAEATIEGIKLTDNKGNSITVDPTNTDTWTVGGKYTTKISNLDCIFSNGISITSASGQYAMGTNYSLDGNTTLTLSDGSTLSVPVTSSQSYKVTGMVPTSSNAIKTLNASAGTATLAADNATWGNIASWPFTLTMINGDTVSVPSSSTGTYTTGIGLSDTVDSIHGKLVSLSTGSTLTNNSNTSYTVNLAGGDTLTVNNSTNTSNNYVQNTSISGTIDSVKGKTVTLSNNDILSNDSGATYTVALANGDTLSIASSSTATYTRNSAPPAGVTVVSSSATSGAGTITLSDGSTIAAANVAQYTIGSGISSNIGSISKGSNTTYTANINSITGLPTANIQKIEPKTTVSITQMTGKVKSGDNTLDSWTTTSSAVTLKPANGLTVSGITLTDDKSNSLKINNSDTTPYKAGDSYTSTINSIGTTMSDGTTTTKTTGSYTMGYSMPPTTTLTVYDTLGNAHSIIVYFTKTKTDSTNGNQWTASVNLDGSGSTEITEPDGSKTKVAMADATLQFKATGTYSEGSGNLNLTLTNGSTGTQTVTVDMSKLTQYAGGTTINGTCDGNAAGTLKSVSIDSSGIITGTYTNGVKQTEAQVAIAQFNNASGLTKTGNSLYQTSNNSGTPNVKTASDLGCTITPSALEMSNVDIANEFSDMIVTQRGFQSNSKIITVSDEMLETMINMKR